MNPSNNILDYGGQFSWQQPAGRLLVAADDAGITLSDPPLPISRQLTWLILGAAMLFAAAILTCRSFARGQVFERDELVNTVAWLGFGWPMLLYARRCSQTTTILRIAGGRIRIERPSAFGRSRIDWPIASVRGVFARAGDCTLNLQQVGNLFIRGRLWDVVVFQRLTKPELEWVLRIVNKHIEKARAEAA